MQGLVAGNFVQTRLMRLAVFRLLLLPMLGVAMIVAPGTVGQVRPPEGPPEEQTAQALYSLAQFTSWRGPLSLSDEVAVCTLGRDPLGRALDGIAGRPAGGRRVIVRRFTDAASTRGCHVVFVGNTERSRLTRILRDLQGSGALTVGDAPEFARRGGMVRLMAEDGRVGLEVNQAALRDGGVRLSSRVLRLARLI